MSGGHYDYGYIQVEQLADDIEREFINDGKHDVVDYSNTDWKSERIITADYFEDATSEQKSYILKEIKSLVKSLHKDAKRAKELEWFMSGDTGYESYIERLKEIK